jgi:hypothetical protein
VRIKLGVSKCESFTNIRVFSRRWVLQRLIRFMKQAPKRSTRESISAKAVGSALRHNRAFHSRPKITTPTQRRRAASSGV